MERGRAPANPGLVHSLRACAWRQLSHPHRAMRRRGARTEPRPQAREPHAPCARRARWPGCKWQRLWDQHVPRGPLGGLARSALKPLPNAAGINIPGLPACQPGRLGCQAPVGAALQGPLPAPLRPPSRTLSSLSPRVLPREAPRAPPEPGQGVLRPQPQRLLPPAVPPAAADRPRGDEVPPRGYQLQLGAEP